MKKAATLQLQNNSQRAPLTDSSHRQQSSKSANQPTRPLMIHALQSQKHYPRSLLLWICYLFPSHRRVMPFSICLLLSPWLFVLRSTSSAPTAKTHRPNSRPRVLYDSFLGGAGPLTYLVKSVASWNVLAAPLMLSHTCLAAGGVDCAPTSESVLASKCLI